jgi:hypothetical protein
MKADPASKRFRSILKAVSALFLVVLATGCAVGQKIRYNAIPLDLKASGSYVVAVSALDHRSYVRNGQKDPSYIGTFRGGFGNPWNVTTESGKPFADDITGVLCASLKTKGFAAKGVLLKSSDSVDAAISALKASSARRLLLLKVTEWRSDTMMNTSIYFNLSLSVLDGQGQLLAESTAKAEEEDLHTRRPKEAVPVAFKRKLEDLLNDPKVVAAMD